MSIDEDRIVERLRNGEEAAFKLLFDRYYSSLCRISFLYVKDDFLSETIVSDVIFHIWIIRESLDISDGSLKKYLSQSVRNKSLDYLKQQYVKRKVSLSDDEAALLENLFLSDDYPLGTLIEKDLESALRNLVDSLPEECRKVFVMSRLGGLKRREIASYLGISVNTVKYHLKRALAALDAEFGKYLPFVLLFLSGLNR